MWEAGRANSGVKSQRRQEGREVSKQKVGSERRKMFYFFKMKESLVSWLIGPEKRWNEGKGKVGECLAGGWSLMEKGDSWGRQQRGWNWTEWPLRWLYSFPGAVITKVPQLGWLKTTEMDSLVLEATSPRSRCWQDCTYLGALGRNPSLFSASFRGFQESLACGYLPPVSACVFTCCSSLCVCLCPKTYQPPN